MATITNMYIRIQYTLLMVQTSLLHNTRVQGMPVTRSTSRALKQSSQKVNPNSLVGDKLKKKRVPTSKNNDDPPVVFSIPPRLKESTFIPAALSFSFQEAQEHLISTDSRFADVFKRLPCGPYEKLEPVDPFR